MTGRLCRFRSTIRADVRAVEWCAVSPSLTHPTGRMRPNDHVGFCAAHEPLTSAAHKVDRAPHMGTCAFISPASNEAVNEEGTSVH